MPSATDVKSPPSDGWEILQYGETRNERGLPKLIYLAHQSTPAESLDYGYVGAELAVTAVDFAKKKYFRFAVVRVTSAYVSVNRAVYLAVTESRPESVDAPQA